MKDLTNKFVVTNRQIEVNTDKLEDMLIAKLSLTRESVFTWDEYSGAVRNTLSTPGGC